MATRLLEARFWDKVDRREAGECWPWVGAKSSSGYGVILLNGKTLGAHRVSYALHHPGEIDLLVSPQGTGRVYVLHACDNRPCVNPAHLRLGSPLDNVWDMESRGRRNWNPPRDRWALSTLTPEIVREIRAEGRTWDGMCDMMRKHGVTQTTVQGIVKGKIYKWFEPECIGK